MSRMPVVVGVDGSEGSMRAAEWAAHRRAVPAVRYHGRGRSGQQARLDRWPLGDLTYPV
jgi:hypothetical protein